jgi:glycosyltransferase involved in cell wall biosynthesis
MTTTEPIVTTESKPELRRVQRHIITPEYPPQPGGVSDYTAQVSEGLAQEGDEVHVWCPGTADATISAGAVHVHRDLGRITAQDLRTVGEQLDRFPAPRRILVQYVPHGYRRRSMNVPFCVWLWRRVTKHGDSLEIMVHEAFLNFEGSWRQYGAALIHRLMTVILLRAASRIWVSIPECGRRWKPYTFGRSVPFQWLPVPSNIRVDYNAAAVQAVRRRYVPEGALLLGHFGTYGTPLLSVLEPIVLKIAREIPEQPLLLMGMGSREFRERLIAKHPGLEKSLCATGPLESEDLSHHIAACDVLIQPYPDGATTRRTSLMVGLSHGKPIVTTSSNVTEPLWEQSAAVGLAASGDADAFVNLLRQVLRDPAERARLTHAARKLYQERFDISHTVAALRVASSESVPCAS